jgi:glutathione S-transferase
MAAVAVVVTKPKFRYLSAWYCPYAHRATIALEHHKDSIDYEWVEALEWKQQTDTNNVTGTGQEWYYHWKADELKRVNPSALVPTLIPMVPLDPTTATAGTTASEAEAAAVVVDESKAVWESLVVVDYIDMVAAAAAGNVPRTNRLVPVHDPYQFGPKK